MKVRNGGWEVVDVKEDVEGDQLGHDAPVALPAEGEEDRSTVFPKRTSEEWGQMCSPPSNTIIV